jgi:hypothetical protein
MLLFKGLILPLIFCRLAIVKAIVSSVESRIRVLVLINSITQVWFVCVIGV